MKLSKLLLVLIPGLILLSVTFVNAIPPSTNTKEIVIAFKNDITLHAQQAVMTKYVGYGYKIIERNEDLNCILVEVKEEKAQEFMDELSKEGSVRYVEPVKFVHALYTPNDPYYHEQWGLPHIKVDKAWDSERGNKNVTIAIIDSGIDYTHEDLMDNYVAGGYDWVNNDSDPMDDYGHGTQCAGIAAATIDNGRGIAGVAQVNIMAEKVLNETGWGTDWDVAQGIIHAVKNGADIISMSLGGNDSSHVMEDACQRAWDSGCLLIAASGNEYKYGVDYPAAYETVIAVGAIDSDDKRCEFSNWGPNLELVAPGADIISTYPSNLYVWGAGTSMAAPHVAGVAALIWSKYEGFTNQEVREKLRQTAIDLGDEGFDEYYGYGKVDAFAAIRELPIFDTKQPEDPYPSIFGIHNGTITPDKTIIATKLYTYPCVGTGGHTEYAKIWNASWEATATWSGYKGDWHNISFDKTVILMANETYNYTIITGSYPQIHHTSSLLTENGWINCTEFIDVNGRRYNNQIPAIKLF
ncbi:MAG: S8 family peptidase [Candidatus Methanospirareceae archaeon]